jgi:hypothetical protein
MQYILTDDNKQMLDEAYVNLDKITIKGCDNILIATQIIARLQYVINELNKQNLPIEVDKERQ